MDTRRAKAPSALAETCGWFLLVLVVSPPSIRGQTLPPGQAIPLVVQNDRCQCVLPTANPDDKFFLILGSTSPGAGLYRVTVQTEATDAPWQIPQENDP